MICESHASPASLKSGDRLRGPTHLTLLATYKCTAACRECCFESNPSHTVRVPLPRLLGYIDEAADTFETLQVAVFSGGECFLLGNDLIEGTARAVQRGLSVRCVSNGYWATTEPAAQRWMERMALSGLKELNLSTGDDHQEFVPFERVARAAVAAVRQRIQVLLVVEGHAGSRFRAGDALRHPMVAALLTDANNAGLVKVIQNVWIPFSTDRDLKPPSPPPENHGCGCDNVLDNVVVTPDEQMAACCGLTMEHIPELKLGDLRQHRMGDLYRRALGDFMKIWLRVEGPDEILRFARLKDPLIVSPGGLAHPCQACAVVHRNSAVRRVLARHWQEKRPEILLRFHALRRLQARAQELAPDPPFQQSDAPRPDSGGGCETT